ncbi:MAG TPA: glycosyltransferase [Pyrinomonadaceae bacterium]|nr:glycosyltransferase [Pyrinomonadaceae bacterium]
MTALPRLKKKLQDNLSLSSKLFLKELFSTSRRAMKTAAVLSVGLTDRVAGVANRLGLNLRREGYSLEPPALKEADFVFLPDVLGRQTSRNHGTVLTSIIIPVFNKAAFTFQCLVSLFQEVDLDTTEIIIVNNASTDETDQILSQLTHLIRVLNNSENKGFVDACNQGAAIAGGKYLVFLNNDTTVLPGWLKYLLETIEGNAAIGAVGSMFLYPDGLLQEAGAIVWQNGEAHHYGWGGSPDDRRFNFAREVDYCSAASLLIRKEIFDRVGGFDRRFAPAYYEDIDLCFAVRSSGYEVIYQPLSRLVHYEGATAGRDTAKGVKHFQILNREKFVDKWRHVLEQRHLEKNLKRLEDAANRKRERPRIIVFDERVPSPDRDAGSARMVMILKALLEWSHVVFVPFNRAEAVDYEAALWKIGIETADAADYRRLLKNPKVQAAIASRPSVAEALIPRIRRISKQITIVFDMVDAHFIRLEREHEVGGDLEAARQARRYRILESRLAKESDLVWCNSSEDKKVMEREVPGIPIEVVPTIHELHGSGKPFEQRDGLLFVGNLAHRPNEDAVHFLMREIYPLLRRALPKVRLSIVGDNVSEQVSLYGSERVLISGYVPDIEPLFQNSRVFVAPLRFGAGVKGKIGEAMSYGLPVVTTTIGAEGFGLRTGIDVLIADDPLMFAEAVTRLYSQKQLWQRLAQNSRGHIQKHFTPEVIAETINNSILEVRKAAR